jgi:hypothetical protein
MPNSFGSGDGSSWKHFLDQEFNAGSQYYAKILLKQKNAVQ